MSSGTKYRRFNLSDDIVPRLRARDESAYREVVEECFLDITAMHQFSSRIEALLQLQNIMNRYMNDFNAAYGTAGRQSKFGARIKL